MFKILLQARVRCHGGDGRQVHGKATRPPSQSWRTFLRNHMTEIVTIDFLTVPTATFRILYVFVVLSLDRRRIVHFNVTDSPTAEWTSLQLIQAFPFETAPRYVIRDRDCIYGEKVVASLRALGVEEKVIGYQSPRAIQPRDAGAVVSEPVLGGLHHRYWRQAA